MAKKCLWPYLTLKDAMRSMMANRATFVTVSQLCVLRPVQLTSDRRLAPIITNLVLIMDHGESLSFVDEGRHSVLVYVVHATKIGSRVRYEYQTTRLQPSTAHLTITTCRNLSVVAFGASRLRTLALDAPWCYKVEIAELISLPPTLEKMHIRSSVSVHSSVDLRKWAWPNSLQTLIVDGDAVFDEHILQLPRLAELSIPNCMFRDETARGLKQLPASLTSLNIGHLDLTDAGNRRYIINGATPRVDSDMWCGSSMRKLSIRGPHRLRIDVETAWLSTLVYLYIKAPATEVLANGFEQFGLLSSLQTLHITAPANTVLIFPFTKTWLPEGLLSLRMSQVRDFPSFSPNLRCLEVILIEAPVAQYRPFIYPQSLQELALWSNVEFDVPEFVSDLAKNSNVTRILCASGTWQRLSITDAFEPIASAQWHKGSLDPHPEPLLNKGYRYDLFEPFIPITSQQVQ